ncbi:MAG: SdpI family protein [Chloroflexota bacterium]
MSAGVLALLVALPRIEPRRQNLERSGTAYIAIGIAVLAFMTVLHAFAVMAALGGEANVVRIVGIGVGVLFIVIGNFLGKTRSNWFFGIRTPWTLTSERSWTRTHRLGGYLFIALGVAMILTTVLFPPEAFVWILMVGLFSMIAVLFGYSYLAWRDDPNRRVLPG